jgi:Family of unknown function (DUF6112)
MTVPLLYANVSLHPSLSALPGAKELAHLVDGVAGFALLGALAALVVGALAWALGAHAHNVHQAASGRRAVLTAGAAALLIGAAPELINFFFHAGLNVR